jgi:hypothetical protein
LREIEAEQGAITSKTVRCTTKTSLMRPLWWRRRRRRHRHQHTRRRRQASSIKRTCMTGSVRCARMPSPGVRTSARMPGTPETSVEQRGAISMSTCASAPLARRDDFTRGAHTIHVHEHAIHMRDHPLHCSVSLACRGAPTHHGLMYRCTHAMHTYTSPAHDTHRRVHMQCKTDVRAHAAVQPRERETCPMPSITWFVACDNDWPARHGLPRAYRTAAGHPGRARRGSRQTDMQRSQSIPAPFERKTRLHRRFSAAGSPNTIAEEAENGWIQA